MKIVSLNVGMPQKFEWQGKEIFSGILKKPVTTPLQLSSLNFEGDKQADLKVHGGRDKAVYGYPAEHYDFWRDELKLTDLEWGAFGENLTLRGLLETEVQIGDRYRMGTAEIVVSQPRMPCTKLEMRLKRPGFCKRFLETRMSGFYFSVAREGIVSVGDEIKLLERSENGVTVVSALELKINKTRDPEMLRRILNISSLSKSWSVEFEERLKKLKS